MMHLVLQIIASVILFFSLFFNFFVIAGLNDSYKSVIPLSTVNLVLHVFIALLVWGAF